MAVLVSYATRHGSTQGVAQRVVARLRERGTHVDVRPMSVVRDVPDYDAVVLGSAIHSGSWLPEAAQFVDRNREALAARPVWLFSVSTLGENSSAFPPRVAHRLRRMRRESQQVARWRTFLDVRDHHDFAGAVEKEHWGASGRAFMAVVRGRYGDHRDWAEIDAWADRIAAELPAATPRSLSRQPEAPG